MMPSLSEDGEHSLETLFSVGSCKIEEFIVSKLNQGSLPNTKEVLEKTKKNVPPVPTSSRYQPEIEEPPQFYHPKNEIKLVYEETSNVNLNEEHLCNDEVQENHSNDNSEFLSEDEHSVYGVQESSLVSSTRDSKLYIDWRIGDAKNRELILDVIKMWKSFPCLWDPKCDVYTQQKRIEAWDSMRHSLKQKWNCEIPKDTLLRKISFLRTQYDQGVRNRRKSTTSKDITVPWFFEELYFLALQTFYCKNCDRVFRSEDSFNHHKCTHGCLSIYVCNVCNKEFVSAVPIIMHKKTHVGVSVQENHVTSIETLESSHVLVTSPKDSKVHKVWRIGDPKHREITLDIIKMWRSYPCLWDPKCYDNTQKTRMERWDTIRRSLKRKWNFDITKDVLMQKIRSLQTQYDHGVRNKRKATTSKDFKVPWFFNELSFLATRSNYCEECDRVFRSEKSFNHHRCPYNGIACYVCNVCNKKFASVHLLKRHNRTHNGVVDRPFECKLCGRTFPIKHWLTLHLRRHTKENSFAM